MSKFDLDKAMRNGGKCMTQDGRQARILCTNAPGNSPLVGYVEYEKLCAESIEASSWNKNGHAGLRTGYALINIPEKRTGWVILAKPKSIFNPFWAVSDGIFYSEKDANVALNRKDNHCLEKNYYRIVQLHEWEE